MDDRRLTVIVVPDGDPETRTYRIPYGRLKIGVGVGTLLLVVFIVMAASWWMVAAQAARVPGLERQVRDLESERAKVAELARTLSEVEQQYERVREMLGAEGGGQGEAVLPPLGEVEEGAAREQSGSSAEGDGPDGLLQVGWPLTQSGYITRSVTGEGPEGHPGVDIAVPQDSYVRTMAAGRVREAARNDVYGRYVVIDHGGGMESLYGHASRLFVAVGDTVEDGEVIALTGSTGRSTAPHLHFEVRRGGRAIDPLRVVARPAS